MKFPAATWQKLTMVSKLEDTQQLEKCRSEGRMSVKLRSLMCSSMFRI
jgi:hypothetical protein